MLLSVLVPPSQQSLPSVWTKPNPPYPTLRPKLLPSIVVVVVVEGEEVVEIEEIEGIEEALQILRQMRLRPDPPDSVVQSIQISLMVSGRGAGCIIGGVSQLISAQSHPHVLGKTSSLQSQQNEV